jgi:hypothetical protein
MYATTNATRNTARTFLLALGGVLLMTGTAARADHGDVRFIYNARPQGHNDRVWVEPVYRDVERVIEVPGVYEEHARRVWVEAVYEVRRVLVRVPEEIVYRKVARYDGRGRVKGYTTVREVVRPCRDTWREERVCVTPGHYETVIEKVCVRPASTKVIVERVLVRDGYWDEVREARPARPLTKIRLLNGPHSRQRSLFDDRDGLRLDVRFRK